jgi:hypothetical protein
MKRYMLVLAIVAYASIASPSATSARLSDLTPETRQAQPNYAYYYGPYRRHVRRVYRRAYRRAYYGGGYYGGYHRPYYRSYYYGPYRPIMGLIVATCAEFIVVHIEGAITDPLGPPCGARAVI